MLALVSCGAFLVSGGADGRVIFWNLTTGRMAKSVSIPETRSGRVSIIEKLLFIEDMSIVCVCTQEGSLHVIDTRSGSIVGSHVALLGDSIAGAAICGYHLLFVDVKGNAQVRLQLHLFILSIYLSIYLSMYPYLSLSLYLSIYVSMYLCIYLFIYFYLF